MDFNLEVPQGHLFVRSVGEKGIRVGDDYLNCAFILSGQNLLADWDVACHSTNTAAATAKK